MHTAITHFLKGIKALIYPHVCPSCMEVDLDEGDICCISCEMSFPGTGFESMAKNAAWQRFYGKIRFENAISAFYFSKNSRLERVIYRLKYGTDKDAGSFLGALTSRQLLKTPWIKDINLIVPVPLHKIKQSQRGYNQSQVISESISELTGISHSSANLIRSRYTQTQTKMHIQERINNVKGAFRLLRPDEFADKHILLVDDVLTTGSTFISCAEAIYNAQPTAHISFCSVLIRDEF